MPVAHERTAKAGPGRANALEAAQADDDRVSAVSAGSPAARNAPATAASQASAARCESAGSSTWSLGPAVPRPSTVPRASMRTATVEDLAAVDAGDEVLVIRSGIRRRRARALHDPETRDLAQRLAVVVEPWATARSMCSRTAHEEPAGSAAR